MGARASVVLWTFNRPEALEQCLEGLAAQTSLDFDVCVADDGSGPETAERAAAARLPVRLEHVWQPGAGARRAEALNRAVLESRGRVLIFLDAEAVPPPGFVEAHLRACRPGRYGVGRRVRHPGHASGMRHPRALALRAWQALRLASDRAESRDLRGRSLSVERESFYRVNGYDQSFEDPVDQELNLGKRLQLIGLRSRALRSAVELIDPERTVARPVAPSRSGPPARVELRAEATLGLREVAEGLRSRAGAPLLRSV